MIPINNFSTKIDNLDNSINQAKKKILDIEYLKSVIYSTSNEFQKEFEDNINKQLSSQGLKLNEINVNTGGSSFDNVASMAYISATLIPTSSKFKFISFKGYDKNGRGKNQSQLRDKKAKLESLFSTPKFSATINEFSLEASNSLIRVQHENRVMIEWRLK